MSWFRRFNFVSTSSHVHLIKFEFWEMKYRLMAFLMLAESKLKSWIIKYGRRDSVELFLQNYIVRPPAYLINSFNLLYKNWFSWHIMKHLSITALFYTQVFIEGHKFFEQYETTFRTLKQAADSYLKSGASGKIHHTLMYNSPEAGDSCSFL